MTKWWPEFDRKIARWDCWCSMRKKRIQDRPKNEQMFKDWKDKTKYKYLDIWSISFFALGLPN